MAAKKKTKKKAAKKRAKRRAPVVKDGERKKAAAKKKARPRKPAKKEGERDKSLDRKLYAEARARGAPKSEAARIAGSGAKSVPALTNAGTRLEEEPYVQELIAYLKEDIYIREIKDPWEKAQARMKQLLDHPEWRARAAGGTFIAKVEGGFAPDKVEHSGSVGVEEGELSKLSKKDRAALRALLKKRGK